MRLKPYRTSILLAIAFTLVLSTFWSMPQLAFIIFISMLLQLLLFPAVDAMSPHTGRGFAAGTVLVGFVLLGGLLMTLVTSTFIPTFSSFITNFPAISQEVQHIPLFEHSTFFSAEMDSLWEELRQLSVDALRSSLSILVSVFSKFIDMIIIFFVTFYLLKDGEQIKAWVANLFPTSDYSRVNALFDRILSALRSYIVGQLSICCITGTVVFLYYTLRGLPYASVFAVVSGVAEFVPVLGPTIASAFGVLLTATTSVNIALQTVLFYVVLTQVNHNIVYPTIIGRSLNLHPVAIILGIILGGELLGPAGMFLAVPIIVICKLVIEDIYRDRQHIRQIAKTSRWRGFGHEDN